MQIREVVEYTKMGVQYYTFPKANNFTLGRISQVTPNFFRIISLLKKVVNPKWRNK